MSVITITITESVLQLIPGIPKFVTLETNIASNIFYTLDGTDPTLFSNVYSDRINFQPQQTTLKLFATNGTDSSPIIEQTFVVEKAVANKLYSHVPNAPLVNDPDKYNLAPFGSITPEEAPIYGDVALDPVDSPTVANLASNGFDEDGNPTNFTDKQLIDLPIIDNPGNGSEPSGIGVFAKNRIEPHKAPFEFTTTKINKYINPRAMVMYQDANDPNADPEAATLNKQFYFSQDQETSRDGAYLNMTANQSNATSGTFINATFNPKTQKTTYRYYDNSTGRWMFSEQDATEAESKPMNVSQIVFGRGEGARFVYKWMPFVGRRY